MNNPGKVRSVRGRPTMRLALVLLVTYIGLFGMLYMGVTPQQYNIKVGTPAPTQIKATKDIQDVVTTEANRERAAAEVEPSYKSADPTVVHEVLSDLTVTEDALKLLRAEALENGIDSYSDQALSGLKESLGFSLSRTQLAALTTVTESALTELFSHVNNYVRDTLDSTLPQGQEATAVRSIGLKLNEDFPGLRELNAIATMAVEKCLRPNMLIDEEITEANRQKARDEVQVIWYVKDQEIVAEGRIVTDAQYAMIAALGLLDENSFDLRLVAGIALIVALVMASAGFYMYRYNRDMTRDLKRVSLLCLISLLTLGCCLGFRGVHSYLMPVPLGFLLVAILLDRQLSLFIHLLLSLLAAMLAPAGSGMYCFLLMTIASPVVLTLFSLKMLRSTVLLAGGILGVVNFLVTMAVGMVNSAQINDVLLNASVAGAAGVAGAMLEIAAQPVLENLFKLATPSKLIELSNPNQPLLRKLLLEASGTYHHSIIVANLSEAACLAIGANGLLARVASYYHDIGKLKRPMYFKENQMGDNPHDRTDPRVSTAILTAHPRDGAQMAQKARIPQEVVEIIRQHHGDTPVMYFYDKAIKQYGAENVNVADFRYEGPRPSTREAAVVMLADTIEAATRALSNPDPEKIDQLIRKLVRGKLNDGQLDNCPLTFADLDKICAAFSTVLTGVFHERIEYPDVTIPPRTETAKAETAAEGEAHGH